MINDSKLYIDNLNPPIGIYIPCLSDKLSYLIDPLARLLAYSNHKCTLHIGNIPPPTNNSWFISDSPKAELINDIFKYLDLEISFKELNNPSICIKDDDIKGLEVSSTNTLLFHVSNSCVLVTKELTSKRARHLFSLLPESNCGYMEVCSLVLMNMQNLLDKGFAHEVLIRDGYVSSSSESGEMIDYLLGLE
jgi:hypothetical protein